MVLCKRPVLILLAAGGGIGGAALGITLGHKAYVSPSVAKLAQEHGKDDIGKGRFLAAYRNAYESCMKAEPNRSPDLQNKCIVSGDESENGNSR